MDDSRRKLLLRGLLGAGLLGLRSLATGLPVSFLLDPLAARADELPCPEAGAGQYLIFSTSGTGDPINNNSPGTYDLPASYPQAIHPDDPQMAATPLSLGGKTYTAAKPWSQLPAEVLGRTQFFHHSTRTNNHSDEQKVMSLMGVLRRGEMAVSLYAKELATCLGTIQAAPVVLAREVIQYQGTTLPRLSPRALAEVLAGESGVLADFQKIRDTDLNRLSSLLKTSGTNTQRAYLDRFATSQEQVRSIPQALLASLAAIQGNDAEDQAIAAAILIKMNVAPVIAMHIPFGGDNHDDPDFAKETRETVSGVATIALLMAKLKELDLQDRVTFATLNVFGRSLAKIKEGGGRSHWSNHHTAILIGKNVKAGVTGGLIPRGMDLGASAIDSKTGAASETGDIAVDDSLASMAKTLGRALEVSAATLDDNITGGLAVTGALV